MRQPQCAHTGAILWAAHSRLSKVKARPSEVVSLKAPSYMLPQTSHGSSVEVCPATGTFSFTVMDTQCPLLGA